MSRLSPSIPEDSVEVLTAARPLTHDDHGKIFFLNLAGGFAVTLPALKAGLVFDFFVKTAPTTAYTVVTSGSANILMGRGATSNVNAAGANVDSEVSGGDTFTFAANKAVIGDHARFVCDGVKWYVTWLTNVVDGATITTAS